MKKRFFSVAIDIPADKSFDYFFDICLPVGCRVRVNFSNKRTTAVVVSSGREEFAKKAIIKRLDDGGSWFSSVDVEFLRRVSDIAWVSWGQMCISAMPKILRGARVWRDFLDDELRAKYVVESKVNTTDIDADIEEFERFCIEKIADKDCGVFFWIVGSQQRAQEIISTVKNQIKDILVFHYWGGIDNNNLIKVIRGINNSKKHCVLVVGTRHLGLFPIVKEEVIFVENAWLDIYRQEVTPKYNLIDVLKERSVFSQGIIYFHKISENKKCKIYFLDAKEHSTFPAFIEEEFRKQVKSGNSCAIFTVGHGYARLIKCSSCKQTMICKRCDMPYTLVKEKGVDYLYCFGCEKKVVWDGRCIYCGSLSIKMGRFSTERWISLVKKRLFDFPIYETNMGKIDKSGVYICRRGQIGFRGRFSAILLLGIDSVIGIGTFYAVDLAKKIVYSASHKTDVLFVRSRFSNLLSRSEEDEEVRKQFYFPPYGIFLQIEIRSFLENKVLILSNRLHSVLATFLKENFNGNFIISDPYSAIFPRKRGKFYYNIDVFLKYCPQIKEILAGLKQIILPYRSKSDCIVTVEMFK